MIETNGKSAKSNSFNNKWVFVLIILTLISVFAIYGINAMNAVKAESPHSALILVSADKLNEDAGLQVPLIAVTAAGGLVDVRIQVADGEKAKTFLNDRTNFPQLLIGKNTVLKASEDMLAQDIQYEKGKFIFLLYPNSGNILKSGDPVNVIFGDLMLEEILSK